MQPLLIRLPWHWLPALLTLAMVLGWHRDVPYHDQWDLLPLLDAWYRGVFDWHTLLTPHNGHLLVLPRLVMLGLAVLTDWNTLAEVLFGFGCMVGCAWLLGYQACWLLQRPLTTSERFLSHLVVFSLSQAQNWLWGWQLQIPLALLTILAGLVALQHSKSNMVAIAGGALCGVAATCSFAGSLPFWLAALPLAWRRGKVALAIWLLLTLGIVMAYGTLLGLGAQGSSIPWPELSEALRHLRNTLAVLGNLPARFAMPAAVLAGLASLVVLGVTARTRTDWRPWLLSVVLFSLGSALLVSLSRSGLGDGQMLASRYGTLTVPFWVMTLLALQTWATTTRRILLSALVLSLLASSTYSIQDFQQLHRRMVKGAEAMHTIDTPSGQQQLAAINPRPDRAQAIAEVRLLRDYRLSHFRER